MAQETTQLALDARDVDERELLLDIIYNNFHTEALHGLIAEQLVTVHTDIRGETSLSLRQTYAAMLAVCATPVLCDRAELLDVLKEMDRRYFLARDLAWEFGMFDTSRKGTISRSSARRLFELVHGEFFSVRKFERMISSRMLPSADVSFAEIEVELCDVPTHDWLEDIWADEEKEKEEVEMKRKEEERMKKEAEERKIREEEMIRKMAEEDLKKKAALEKREDEDKKARMEKEKAKRLQEEAKKKADEEAKKKADEDAKKKKQEEEEAKKRKAKESEKKRKDQEEKKRKVAEEKAKQLSEAQRLDEEARLKREEEEERIRKEVEEQARLAEEATRQKEEEENKAKTAEEQARLKEQKEKEDAEEAERKKNKALENWKRAAELMQRHLEEENTKALEKAVAERDAFEAEHQEEDAEKAADAELQAELEMQLALEELNKATTDEARAAAEEARKKAADVAVRNKEKRLRLGLHAAVKQRKRPKIDAAVADAEEAKEEIPTLKPDIAQAKIVSDSLKCGEQLEDAMAARDLAGIEKTVADIKEKGYEKDHVSLLSDAEKLVAKLKRLERMKRELAALDQRLIAEIRSYKVPPPVVHQIMTAVYIVLKYKEKELKQWKFVQALLGRTGKESLKRMCTTLESSQVDLSLADVADSKYLKGLELDEIREISHGVATFFAWATATIEEARSWHQDAGLRHEIEEKRRLEAEETAKLEEAKKQALDKKRKAQGLTTTAAAAAGGGGGSEKKAGVATGNKSGGATPKTPKTGSSGAKSATGRPPKSPATPAKSSSAAPKSPAATARSKSPAAPKSRRKPPP